MFKIQTLNAIAAIGTKQFPNKMYEIGNHLPEADAILVRSHNMHDMPISSSLLAVGRAGAGVNNIPVAEFTARGIPVFNTPGANANAVRELVIAGMLLGSRNICQAWHYVENLNSTDNKTLNEEVEQNKKRFAGFELMGKILGVVGLGSIGVKVANTAISLGMRVIGFDPTITVNRAWELSANVEQAHHLKDLLKHADVISMHVPLTSTTKNMIDSHAFTHIKPQAVLLNFAREGIIDQQALLSALAENKLHAYVADFPAVEFKNHTRAICLPHLGASTKEAEENCAVMIVKQIRDYLELGVISNAVNFPTVDAPGSDAAVRLAIVNRNVPNMVAQISTKLADAGLNIVSLVNKSLHDIAYTLVDVNHEITNDVLQQIESIEGVIHTRKIW